MAATAHPVGEAAATISKGYLTPIRWFPSPETRMNTSFFSLAH